MDHWHRERAVTKSVVYCLARTFGVSFESKSCNCRWAKIRSNAVLLLLLMLDLLQLLWMLGQLLLLEQLELNQSFLNINFHNIQYIQAFVLAC